MRIRSVRRALCAVAAAAAYAAAVGADEQRIARARELLDLFLAGKYEPFCEAGDEKMRAALTPTQAAQIMEMIEFQIGRFRSVGPAKYTQAGGTHVVDFECTFEKGTCTLRVVLTDAGRLTGFWLPAVTPSTPYSPPDYADPTAFEEQKVTVDAGSFPLPGTLAIPKGATRCPLVVLVHGSGAHDEDETIIANKPFRDLAWGLASRGVAVLRYEKRTHKYPTATTADDCTLEWETIDDAAAAAELARRQERIDPKRVFVLGHSLGAMAAPFVARKDGKLAGIVLLAGNARPVLDLILDQSTYIAGIDGTVSDQEKEQLDQLRAAAEKIRAGETDGVPPAAGLPAKYLARLQQLDPVAAARELSTPMLVIQGARDYQVTTEDFELWKKGLAGRDQVRFKLYDDLNHLFMPGTGKSTPAEYQTVGHIDRRVVEDVAEWIKSVAPAP